MFTPPLLFVPQLLLHPVLGGGVGLGGLGPVGQAQLSLPQFGQAIPPGQN
jgi:hypothetical protein